MAKTPKQKPPLSQADAEALTKKLRGNTTMRQRPDSTVQTAPGDNTRFINHSLEIYSLPKIDLYSPEQVEQRSREYIQICAKNDMKPSIAGYALALGCERTYLWDMRKGKTGKPREVLDTLKKTCAFINAQMEDFMQNGKINPVSGIFLMKNNMGYTDQQEVVLTPNNPLGEKTSERQLRDKYNENIIIDDTDGAESAESGIDDAEDV